jgi:tRNA(fMet)-specific endonuclease VapC
VRYLIDTDILLFLRQGRNRALVERFRWVKPNEAAMSVITYGELVVGERRSKRKRETAEEVSSLVKLFPVLSLTTETANHYGKIRAYLERSGQIIGNNDLWIAAHAIAEALTLVTNNEREFRRVKGLKVENWSKPGPSAPK